jgi:two-component system phosphate regulon sensor histidine kinase PhoR
MKSFRSRIITAVLTASFLSIAITVFYGVRTIDQSQRLAVRDRLVSDAAMAADYYAKTGGAAKDLYTLLSGRMHLKGVRLTVMDPSGTIVFDSAKPKDGSFDNHKDRPEVIEAMKSGSGYSTRDSASLGLELAYATSAIEGGGVLRLAVPMENVHRAIHDRTELLIQVGIWAALISLVIAFLVSQALRRSFSPMIDIVEAIAAGRFNRRIRKYPGKEFEPLARAVNSMAEGIEEQVHAYADQTAQLEAVLNTMEDGVLVLGPRGHIRRCNLALERAFPGVGNARGRQCVEVIPHPALQKTVDEILSSPSDGTARTVSLHLGLTSGQVFSVLLSRPAQPDPRFGLVAVFRDGAHASRAGAPRFCGQREP